MQLPLSSTVLYKNHQGGSTWYKCLLWRQKTGGTRSIWLPNRLVTRYHLSDDSNPSVFPLPKYVNYAGIPSPNQLGICITSDESTRPHRLCTWKRVLSYINQHVHTNSPQRTPPMLREKRLFFHMTTCPRPSPVAHR